MEGATMNGQGYTVGDLLTRFIGGIRMLAVPRIEDLPYWTSPPIQFVFESTATLAFGQYVFTGVAAASPVPRPLRSNVLYYFRNISLVADIDEGDFQSSISTTPVFQVYKQSENGLQLFREPIRMSTFFDQFDYRLVWQTQNDGDTLTASFFGTLTQIPALLGKASITLKAIIAAQEILDDRFTRMFRDHSYPQEVQA
jgi:hypothetical protein